MAKFHIKDTQLCYVTWSYEVEAANEEEALELFREGDHAEACGHEVGDASSVYDGETTVEKLYD